jgi:predicted phosphodiesterase
MQFSRAAMFRVHAATGRSGCGSLGTLSGSQSVVEAPPMCNYAHRFEPGGRSHCYESSMTGTTVSVRRPQSFYNPADLLILLLSDIHSNLEALEACLAAAPSYDLVVNLGDLVGYGASPNEVIARCRALGQHFVRGNHDKAASGLTDLRDFNPLAGVAALWTRDHLSPENLEWLRNLPIGPVRIDELPGIQFVHGSPADEDEYMVSMDDAIEPLMLAKIPLTFFGHTHLQGAFYSSVEGGEYFRPEYKTAGTQASCEFRLQGGLRYLVNPGSIGQPRDGDWRAAFATFEVESRTVTFWRVPYSVKSAQDRILAANLPQRLATRLAAGR